MKIQDTTFGNSSYYLLYVSNISFFYIPFNSFKSGEDKRTFDELVEKQKGANQDLR